MQKELMEQRHIDLLRNDFRTSPDEIERMDSNTFNDFVWSLKMAKCIEMDREMNHVCSEREQTIREILSIVTGARPTLRARLRELLAS